VSTSPRRVRPRRRRSGARCRRRSPLPPPPRAHRSIAEAFEHDIEQITRAAAVERADRHRFTEAEREEPPQVFLATGVVRLVRHDERVVVPASQPVGNCLVLLERAHRRVDHEQHEVGLVHGGLDLPAHLRVEVVAAGHPPAGVDEAERHTQPLGVHLLAVASDAGAVLDDRGLLAHDAVEQRALTDVRPSDDHDGRQPGQLCARRRAHRRSSAARSAMPSVVITSTGRGRSSTRSPSRNWRESDRHTSGSRYRCPSGSSASTR
jgi:hypothetical protein